MKLSQVALQCYTIRDHCQTEAEFAKSMARVAAIGYRAVQISAIGPIEPKRVRAICDDHGLTICATHEDGKQIVSDPNPLIEKLGVLGCRDTAYPWPAIEHTAAGYLELAEKLVVAVERFAEAGLRLSYHNHALEFVRYGYGTPMDMLFKRVPEMGFELDTYWIQYGGASPADWCVKCAGRLPLLHLKDFAVLDNSTIVMAAVGDGNLNWPDIITKAEASGCEWLIVEQDRHWQDDDPFVAATRSFDFIRDHLVEKN
ncbi:MAG: sugar phosphate isomerase/epimerase [Phycisphaeraceae bacterium]